MEKEAPQRTAKFSLLGMETWKRAPRVNWSRRNMAVPKAAQRP